jgi:hypothetical protein
LTGPEGQEQKSNEELWDDGVAEELSAVIQSNPDLPVNLPPPFDPLSETSAADQK